MQHLAAIDRRHPDWIPLVILLLLGIAFFFPALFMGRAASINSLRNFEPWRSVRLENGDGSLEVQPSGARVYTWNTNEGFADDLNRQFMPWGFHIQERLRSGGWPLWNPHVACGQPLFANHQTGLTNPLILLCYYLFPGQSAFIAIFLSIFILTGWGMYAYLRILGLGRWSSLLAAASYQLMLGYIPTLDTLVVEKALFPFLLYSVERIVRAPSGKGSVWVFLSIILLALIQTSCHAQEAVFASYLLGPYILFIAGDQNSFPRGRIWRTIGKRLALAVGICIPALFLGLVQNLPTYEFYSLSTRAVGFEEQISSATELEQGLSWIQSLMIVFPRLFGDYILKNMPLEHYLLNYGYVGIVTIIAAPFAGWIAATRRQVWFWRIAALIFFVAIISNWWYFNVLCQLPLFRVSLQKPFSPLFFSLIVLAGHGFGFLLDPRPTRTSANRWLGYLTVSVFGTVLSFGVLLAWALILPGRPFNAEQTYVFGQIELGAAIAGLACLVISIYWRQAARAGNEKPGRASGLANIAALALLAVILLDLWPVKTHFNPLVKREHLYFPTDTTNLLVSRLDWQPGDPDGPYRFGRSWKEILPPNTPMIYGLDDVSGYDSILVGRYARLLEAIDSSIIEGVHFLEAPRTRTAFESKVWNMLGVKYVLAHPGHFGQFEPAERWRHIYIGEILMLHNTDVLPRMHLVDRVTVAGSRDDALPLTAELDPSIEAVVTRSSPVPIELTPSDDPIDDPPGSVSITSYFPERVTARVSCDRPALLCFYDTMFPGWEVTVDGAPADLECVNYTFKGVFVDAGNHEVVFRYRPVSVRYGLLGTIIGFLLALGLARPVGRIACRRDSEPSVTHSSDS